VAGGTGGGSGVDDLDSPAAVDRSVTDRPPGVHDLLLSSPGVVGAPNVE